MKSRREGAANEPKQGLNDFQEELFDVVVRFGLGKSSEKAWSELWERKREEERKERLTEISMYVNPFFLGNSISFTLTSRPYKPSVNQGENQRPEKRAFDRPTAMEGEGRKVSSSSSSLRSKERRKS